MPPPLRGLCPTTGRPDRGEPAGATIAPPRTEGVTQLRRPVIRLLRLFLRYELLAIYETHLLTGKSIRRPPITEEMCYPRGEPALADLLSWPRRIAFADIVDIREEAPKISAKMRSKTPANQSHLTRFTMKMTDGRTFKASVPALQAENVRKALSSRLADRYWVRRTSILDGLSTTFLVIIGLATCVGWIITFPILLWKFLTRNRRKWTPVRDYTDAPAVAKAARRKAAASRNAFRSGWLGWPLKILGVTYAIVMWSPLTDGLDDALDKSIKNWNQRQTAWASSSHPRR